MSSMFEQLSNAMADAVEALSPALVRVEARRRQAASGIVWSADGVIVTAHHVVEMDEGIMVGMADGTERAARLVGRDPNNDLAVLKVEAATQPAIFGGEDQLRVGQLVLAVARPGRTVQATLGTVSALVDAPQRRASGSKRGRRGMGQVLTDGYIQTDVLMYPGFSGGALLGGDGKVYGLNTSGFGSGMSLAVPLTTIRNTVATLLAHGKMKQGYLGVGVQSAQLPQALAEQVGQMVGLLVVSVEAGSPAEQGGILLGDILLSVDGETTEHVDDLLSLLSGARIGKAVAVRMVRAGALTEVTVMIGERA
ncbi:MAG: S1C family serine protease [Anaerolineae bacterium]|nr:S1C family serine protease [Anaerolineae bacterium]MDW8173406.1 trypsin-like peptidase domain-containing protein [Anaerolineae bacterium]